MDDVQIDGYAGNTERGPVARVDTVDLVGIVNSGLKTRRDAPPCRYGGAETALLNISSRVPDTGLKNSRHTQTAVPQTDVGPIIVRFNERVDRARTRRRGADDAFRIERGRGIYSPWKSVATAANRVDATTAITAAVARAENSRSQRDGKECC